MFCFEWNFTEVCCPLELLFKEIVALFADVSMRHRWQIYALLGPN